MIRQNNWISVSFRNEYSHRLNMSIYDITSWLQKSIRRWIMADAMIYTRELIEAWQLNYIWKRLFLFIVEDIWLANIYLIELILDYYQVFLDEKNDDTFNDEYIYKSIYAITMSPKNRENANFYRWIKNFNLWNSEEKTVIEKYCIPEIYNYKSKKLKENILLQLSNDFKTEDNINTFNNYTKALLILWDLNWKDWLNLFFIHFFMLKKYNNKYTVKKDWLSIIKEKISKYNTPFLNINNFIIKDYIYDKHTLKWKQLNRWDKHFFEIWSYVTNEIEVNNNKFKKEILKRVK